MAEHESRSAAAGEIKRDYERFPEPEKHTPPENPHAYIERLKHTDSRIADFLLKINIDPYGTIVPGMQGSRALDPDLVSRNIISIGMAMGTAGVARFIAEQTALYAMNTETSRVFDPFYFFERLPIINSTTRLTLDTAKHADYVAVRELELMHSSDPFSSTPELTENNPYTPANRYRDGADMRVGDLVDAEIDGTRPKGLTAAEMFVQDPVTLGWKPSPDARNKTRAARPDSGLLGAAAYPDGLPPATFPGERVDGSIVTKEHQDPQTVLPDDLTYVPLSFTDLRPINGNELRTVYFRPFDLTLNEAFAPRWNEATYFGRVDPVMTYQGTTRTVSLSFTLHTFSPSDIRVIYQKLHWLKSMVYPEYGSDMLMKSGPVCRLRVGDVLKSHGHGVSGVITSLDLDYADALWELKKGSKVPRQVGVSVSFTVLHDAIIGLRDGTFGALVPLTYESGRASTPSGETTVRKTTVYVGERGRFAGYGEPRKEG